ncbi:aldehyde dehydrogenase [Sulfolobales archaeon HS-7]|nr:aldehyde dehydrogenase [Sulfolobales archaeon HS-7]
MKGYILAGEEVQDTNYLEVVNPSSGEPFEKVSSITSESVAEKALEEAISAFHKFKRTSLKDRAKILLNAVKIIEEKREHLARVLAMEAGKPIKDSRVEILRAISVFRIAAEETRFVLEGKVHRVDAYEYPPGNENRIVMEVREPIGVVLAILPFNFPANSFAHKVAPNIMAGNTIIVKPSTLTPLSAIEMGKILYEAGLPKGVLSVLVGPSKVVAEPLIKDMRVAGITFTGSTVTGTEIASKAVLTGKKIMMEMGGSDPVIVFDDADLSKAVPIIAKARFEYAGQNCNAGKRIIVHEKIYDKFVELYRTEVAKFRVGDALSEETDVGPLISKDAVESMRKFVTDAEEKGKTILRLQNPPSKGYYFPLSIIVNADLSLSSMKEEVFGPIAPIAKFSTEEEAVEIANSTHYGLQSSMFTADVRRGLRVAQEMEFGAVMINNSTRLRWDALPFGGVKMSGLGNKEGVRNTILGMTESKLISLEL